MPGEYHVTLTGKGLYGGETENFDFTRRQD